MAKENHKKFAHDGQACKKNLDEKIERDIEAKFEAWAGGCGKHNVFWRVFWGVFFLVAAGAVAAQIFGFFSFSIGIWWLILATFLFAIIIASLVKLNWFGVFVSLACLVTIANYQTNWLSLSGQEVGALFGIALLLTIAFSILFHKKSYRSMRKYWSRYERVGGASETSADDEREVAVRANFGSAVRYIESKNLEKVLIDCKFGAAKVYLSNARPAGKETTVLINCAFGGLELYVPRTWRIVNGLDANLGGVEEKGRTEISPDSPTVRLIGSANLGGVEIVYV
ncbi:hypothetical protein FWD20_03720 [Candidatus Saccharibacteria bacterium]|nr:hypothetical protein [Candidatus Saccharibacteria bacterium]